MAVTAFWYGLGLKHLALGDVDFEADDIYVMLLDNTHTPDQDAHEYIDDVSADEVSGDGYTAGGAQMSTPALTYTGGTNVLKFSGANVSWAASTITAAFAVVYKNTGTPGTSPVLVYIDFDGDVSTTSGTFQITWHADGIATITAS